jgi:hypothetical protein
MIEKIIKGYKLANLDMKFIESQERPFVAIHPKLCAGSKEELYSIPMRAGGLANYIRHPVKAYKILKYAWNNKDKFRTQ